ncbi:hypothetical protein O9K51_01376 [Purpureocillium lavendulum]|uniref:Uncharacterized protein n=1 Tax=Purpureocillium lavendulum TaxID=1247861 RepID=A0AB34G5R2_9HYPO|nr:hypothetical protein O9K51_01376 [Purpureocillium lavendulum]
MFMLGPGTSSRTGPDRTGQHTQAQVERDIWRPPARIDGTKRAKLDGQARRDQGLLAKTSARMDYCRSIPAKTPPIGG